MKRALLVISIVFSCMIVFAGVSNAADIGFNGIGGKIGLVMPDGPADNTG